LQQDNNQKKSNSLAWLFLAIVIVYFVLMIAVNMLDSKGISIPTYPSLILSEVFILLPGLIYVLKNNLSLKEDLGFKKVKVGTIFLSILLGVLAIPVASFVNVLTQFFVSNTMTQASDALLDGSYIVILFLAGVFGPFCEEFVFRGIFAFGYDRVSKPMRAILMSALLFGLMHLNVNQTCYAFVLGIIFAIVNKASGSIVTSIILHVVINSINMLMLIISDIALKMAGSEGSISGAAEEARKSPGFMAVIAIIYFVISIVCIAISVPIVLFISKHEGRSEEFKNIFRRKKKDNESNEIEENDNGNNDNGNNENKAKVLMNVPAIISVVICLFVIFLFDPIMKMLGWS